MRKKFLSLFQILLKQAYVAIFFQQEKIKLRGFWWIIVEIFANYDKNLISAGKFQAFAHFFNMYHYSDAITKFKLNSHVRRLISVILSPRTWILVHWVKSYALKCKKFKSLILAPTQQNNIYIPKTQRPPEVPHITICSTNVADHADVKIFGVLWICLTISHTEWVLTYTDLQNFSRNKNIISHTLVLFTVLILLVSLKFLNKKNLKKVSRKAGLEPETSCMGDCRTNHSTMRLMLNMWYFS
jgi:hypothetical protein